MRLPITIACERLSDASPGFGVSGMAPATPRAITCRTSERCASPPNRSSAAAASAHVVASGTPGPDPIALRSSPTTSEMASVTVVPTHAAARRPPFTFDRCRRTVFSA